MQRPSVSASTALPDSGSAPRLPCSTWVKLTCMLATSWSLLNWTGRSLWWLDAAEVAAAFAGFALGSEEEDDEKKRVSVIRGSRHFAAL